MRFTFINTCDEMTMIKAIRRTWDGLAALFWSHS